MNIIDSLRPYISINKLNETKKTARCDCPFCQDKNNSFVMSDNSNSFKCFSCGETGDANYFIDRLSEIKTVRIINPKVFEKTIKEQDEYSKKLIKINNEAGKYFYKSLQMNKKAMSYFADRKLSSTAINHFGLGYADSSKDGLYRYLLSLKYTMQEIKDAGLISISQYGKVYDRFQDRVMFPIINVDGDVVGFGGRRLDDSIAEMAKYINSPETKVFNKSNNLFALNFAQKTQNTGMILCEGYMDVITLHENGFINSVAALGTAFNDAHASLLRKHIKTVYLCLDNDQAGINAKLKALPILRKHGFDVNVIDLSPYKDPDEFIKALGIMEFANRTSTAVNGYYYEINTLLQKYNNDIDSEEFKREIGEKMYFSTDTELEEYQKAYHKIKSEQMELYSNFEEIEDYPENIEGKAPIVRLQNISVNIDINEDESESSNTDENEEIYGFDDVEIELY